jgi:beta-lactam-binding protein with PASTA domain
MSRTFHIVAASDTVELDSQGAGEVTFNVTNAQTTSQRRKALVVPGKAEQAGWYTLREEPERLIAGGETVQFRVAVRVPPGTAAGRQTFRLDLVQERPEEDPVQGQSVSFEVRAAEQPKKIRWGLIGAVAGGLVAVGVLTAVLWPRGTELPEFIGTDFAAAQEWLLEHELELVEVQEVRDQEDPRVTDQQPAAGTRVRDGDQVTLTRAMPFLEVPDLRGVKTRAAQDQLLALRLVPGEITELTGLLHDADTVVEQDPAPGARVRPETPVLLTIEAPVRAVPDLRGLEWSAAAARLAELGLREETTFRSENPAQAGKVLSQDPNPQLQMQKGGVVTLVAEAGRVPAPSVVGLALPQAIAAVEAAGLVAKVEAPALIPGATVGAVGSQSPAPQSPLTEGSTLVLIPAGRPVPVPNLVGLPLDAAQGRLAAAGFQVAVQNHYTDTPAPGQVLFQSPPQGEPALEGSAVTCTVSAKQGRFVLDRAVLLDHSAIQAFTRRGDGQ